MFLRLLPILAIAVSLVTAVTWEKCNRTEQICVSLPLCNPATRKVIVDGSGTLKSRFGGESFKSCDLEAYELCCSPPPEFRNLMEIEEADSEVSIVDGCGFRDQGSLLTRVSGGVLLETGELPWNVALLTKSRNIPTNNVVYFCGGSLIHKKVVLTSATCASVERYRSLEGFTVRAGDTDLNKDRTDQIYQDVSVEKIIRHPEYNSNNHYDDIALLILKEEFEITSNVGIVCVPNQDHAFDNEKCWVSGFGANEQRGKFEKRLLKVEIPVVPNPVCQRLLRNSNLGPWFILSQKLICAGGEEGKDACNGDGGAALVCLVPGSENRYCQAGIVAYSASGCGVKDEPGIYVKVSLYREWIDTQFEENQIVATYRIDKEGECMGPKTACGKPNQCDKNNVILAPELKEKAEGNEFAFAETCSKDSICCTLK